LLRLGARVAIVAFLGVAGAIYGMTGGSSLPSFPSAIAYEGASLTQATKWERDRTGAAVYIPAGEAMPGASLQLGIISSREYPTADSLLRWIQVQSQAAPMQRFHDVISGNERCLVGLARDRAFLALQLCKSGKELAACVESDREIDNNTLGSCLNSGCFADLCDKKWLEERNDMDRVLAGFLTP
jgi:hypothetical protein